MELIVAPVAMKVTLAAVAAYAIPLGLGLATGASLSVLHPFVVTRKIDDAWRDLIVGPPTLNISVAPPAQTPAQTPASSPWPPTPPADSASPMPAAPLASSCGCPFWTPAVEAPPAAASPQPAADAAPAPSQAAPAAPASPAAPAAAAPSAASPTTPAAPEHPSYVLDFLSRAKSTLRQQASAMPATGHYTSVVACLVGWTLLLVGEGALATTLCFAALDFLVLIGAWMLFAFGATRSEPLTAESMWRRLLKHYRDARTLRAWGRGLLAAPALVAKTVAYAAALASGLLLALVVALVLPAVFPALAAVCAAAVAGKLLVGAWQAPFNEVYHRHVVRMDAVADAIATKALQRRTKNAEEITRLRSTAPAEQQQAAVDTVGKFLNAIVMRGECSMGAKPIPSPSEIAYTSDSGVQYLLLLQTPDLALTNPGERLAITTGDVKVLDGIVKSLAELPTASIPLFLVDALGRITTTPVPCAVSALHKVGIDAKKLKRSYDDRGEESSARTAPQTRAILQSRASRVGESDDDEQENLGTGSNSAGTTVHLNVNTNVVATNVTDDAAVKATSTAPGAAAEATVQPRCAREDASSRRSSTPGSRPPSAAHSRSSSTASIKEKQQAAPRQQQHQREDGLLVNGEWWSVERIAALSKSFKEVAAASSAPAGQGDASPRPARSNISKTAAGGGGAGATPFVLLGQESLVDPQPRRLGAGSGTAPNNAVGRHLVVCEPDSCAVVAATVTVHNAATALRSKLAPDGGDNSLAPFVDPKWTAQHGVRRVCDVTGAASSGGEEAERVLRKAFDLITLGDGKPVSSAVSMDKALPPGRRAVGALTYRKAAGTAPAHWASATPLEPRQAAEQHRAPRWFLNETQDTVDALEGDHVLYAWLTEEQDRRLGQGPAACFVCEKPKSAHGKNAAVHKCANGYCWATCYGSCLPDSWQVSNGGLFCTVCKGLPEYTAPPSPVAAAAPVSAAASVAAVPITPPAPRSQQQRQQQSPRAPTSTPNATAAPDNTPAVGPPPSQSERAAAVAAAIAENHALYTKQRQSIIKADKTGLNQAFMHANGKYAFELSDAEATANMMSGLDPSADPTSRLAGPSGMALTGADFVKVSVIKDLKQSPFSKLAVEGLSESVRRFHRDELFSFKEYVALRPQQQALPLPQLVLRYIRHKLLTARTFWQPQTFQRRLHNILAALALLPAYSNAAAGVSLKSDPEVSAILKAISLKAAQAQPTRQTAATWESICIAVEKETLVVVKVALLLQWILAARVGDILHLTKQDLTLAANNLDVTFSNGKGVRFRKGKYTVHTVIPERYRPLLAAHLATLGDKELVVPATTALQLAARLAAMNAALKRANSKLSTRSIRRGALQAMAMGTLDLPPVPLDTLMSYAGHTRPETTRRYLDWSRLFGAGALLERQAAAALARPSL